jgi:hypothetical protein
LWLDYGALRPPAAHAHYFADDLSSLSDREVLIDCGAYDGDTIREFTRRRGSNFAAIRAYEPDEATSPGCTTSSLTWTHRFAGT